MTAREIMISAIPTGQQVVYEGDIVIAGDLPADANIFVHGNITILGKIGDRATIRADGALHAHAVGQDAHLTVDKDINLAGDIGDRARICSAGTLHAHNMGTKASVTADTVYARNVGEKTNVTSTKGGMDLQHIGADAQLNSASILDFKTAQNNVEAYAIGELSFNSARDSCRFTAANIEGFDVGEKGHFTSTDGDITLRNVGQESVIHSAKSVCIDEDIGSNTRIRFTRTIDGPKVRGCSIKKIEPRMKDIGCGIEYDTEAQRYIIPSKVISHTTHEGLVYLLGDLIKAGAVVEKKTSVTWKTNFNTPKQMEAAAPIYLEAGSHHTKEQKNHLQKLIGETLTNYVNDLDKRYNGNSAER